MRTQQRLRLTLLAATVAGLWSVTTAAIAAAPAARAGPTAFPGGGNVHSNGANKAQLLKIFAEIFEKDFKVTGHSERALGSKGVLLVEAQPLREGTTRIQYEYETGTANQRARYTISVNIRRKGTPRAFQPRSLSSGFGSPPPDPYAGLVPPVANLGDTVIVPLVIPTLEDKFEIKRLELQENANNRLDQDPWTDLEKRFNVEAAITNKADPFVSVVGFRTSGTVNQIGSRGTTRGELLLEARHVGEFTLQSEFSPPPAGMTRNPVPPSSFKIVPADEAITVPIVPYGGGIERVSPPLFDKFMLRVGDRLVYGVWTGSFGTPVGQAPEPRAPAPNPAARVDAPTPPSITLLQTPLKQ